MSEINYQKDTHIDDTALDIEWLDQAELMRKYTFLESKMKYEVDLLTEELSILRAELDRDIREDPEAFGITKLTEGAISNTIILQDEYKEKQKELIEARHEHNNAKGAVESMQHKKYALQGLVELFGKNYFAGPSVPRNLNYEVAQKMKRIESNKVVKIKRRNKK